MSKFGYSLPPGCGSLPGEEDDRPCDVCGKFEDDCICPECPNCGDVGNPKCYMPSDGNSTCGMTKSQEQIDSLAEAENKWAEDNQAHAEAEAEAEIEAAAFMRENEQYDLKKESELQ